MGRGGENSSITSGQKHKAAVKLTNEEVLIENKIYSVDSLASTHPGGEMFVKAFAGRDATEAFLSYHRKQFPHETQQNALKSTLPTSKKSPDVSTMITEADFLELCALVEKVLPRHKSFAPTSYWVKMTVILTFSVGLEAYIHITGSYYWYLSAILGLFMALIGLNIQHDANHGALSKNPTVNKLLGMTQNYIGGSRIDWLHQHVVQHHISTNDIQDDPDMSANDMLRLNPVKPLMKYHMFQYLYTFILLAGFGFAVTSSTLRNLIAWKNYTKISSKLTDLKPFEISTSLFFFFRWVVLPLSQQPSIYTLLNICPMFIVCGYYLAFFFILSHNFEGAENFDKHSTDKTFLYRQAASSSNVGGSILCFMNGGLNYQIEHHLFPRIQHTHYPTIAPVVREFCLSKGIPYVHFPTISENVRSCLEHLYIMGNSE